MNLDTPQIAPLVRELIARYTLTSFVETGTGYAKSLRWAYGEGLDCWSCDVDPDQVANARAICPDAHLYACESLAFLTKVGPLVPGRALFWLDAHDPNKGERVPAWPVEDELALIIELRNGRDVILMDDIADPRFHFDAIYFPNHTPAIRHGVLILEPQWT